ncbi:MAG: hypothetical protein FWH04_08090 [Oscillospiraceae bacterium]|nr:hypothetical protein [Oscillospiraceae bacterium]
MIGILYMAMFPAGGLIIADWAFRRENALERLTLGLASGLFLLMWLPALAAFFMGFGIAAQITALAVLLAGVAAIILLRKHRIKLRDLSNGLLKEKSIWAFILPLFAFSCYLLHTHILLPDANGALMVGQSTFGDLNLHASMMTSVAEQGVFPPQYSLLAGKVGVGYPFLSNTVSSSLLVLGASLRLAYMAPMVLGLLCILLSCFVFFRAFLQKAGRAVFAASMFFIGGGFGFSYIFDLMQQTPGKLQEMMDAFYKTPTNNVEMGVKWVNVIADMLIPQRATLFGWSILFVCMFLLLRAIDGEKKLFVPLGVFAGGLPLIHAHSFLVIGMLSAVYLLFALYDAKGDFRKTNHFFIFGAIAVALALPQLIAFTFQQAGSGDFFRYSFNWDNSTDNYFWFYIKNMGLAFVVMIPAFLHADRRKKRIFAGGALIWLIAEFFLFQPLAYDNNKLIFISYLILCGLVADWLADVFKSLRAAKIRGTMVLAVLVVVVLNVSGVLTLAREAVSEFQLFSEHHVEATDFIRAELPKDALFLTADNHNNAVAVLSGRNIVCGSGTFLYFHGLDYTPARDAAHDMLKSPNIDALKNYGVDYVYIGDAERGMGDGIDTEFFERELTSVFRNNTVTIYEV